MSRHEYRHRIQFENKIQNVEYESDRKGLNALQYSIINSILIPPYVKHSGSFQP